MKWRLGLAAFYATAILGVLTAEDFRVQLHETPLVETPDPFGKKIVMLDNGETVEKTGADKDDYYPVKVKATGATGWVAMSDVCEPKEFKTSGSGATATKEGEQGAFVKGFDPEVEKKYRTDHPDLDSIYEDDVNPMIRATTCGGLGLNNGEMDDLEQEKLTLQLQGAWTPAVEAEYESKFRRAEGVRKPKLDELSGRMKTFREKGKVGEFAKRGK